MIDYNEAFINKSINSYPSSIIHDLNLIRIDKANDNIKPIGSMSYRGTKYAGDFDFYEEVVKETKEETIKFFITNLKRIVKEILKNDFTFFMEVKCGYDEKFIFDIGTCENGLFIVNPELIDQIKFNEHNFNKNDFIRLIDILTKKILNQFDYEELNNIIREYKILRWTPDEILKGNKKGIKLQEAVEQKGNINIEIITNKHRSTSELSNFFNLCYMNGDKKIAINLEQDYIDDTNKNMIIDLQNNINKLVYSKISYNPLKALKRYFSLARILQDENLRLIVSQLINSEPVELGQLNSIIKTNLKLLKKYHNSDKYDKEDLLKELDNIKYRLSSILMIDNDIVEEFIKYIDRINKNYDVKRVINTLEDMNLCLTDIINEASLKLLSSFQLFPVPYKYENKITTYKYI